MTCVVVVPGGGSAGSGCEVGPESWNTVRGGGIVDELAAGASMDVAVALR